MKAAVLLLVVAASAAGARYVGPYGHRRPSQEQVYRGLADFFSKLSVPPGKRCVNTLDNSCANGGIPGAASDEDWLTNNPIGKRCVNLYDDSCVNGGINVAGSDEDWLESNLTPGRKRR